MTTQSQHPDLPPSHPPATAAHTNHGRTVAAWALFYGASLAALVAAIGFIIPSMPLIWAGVAVAALSVIASVALRLAGLGQPKDERSTDSDDEFAHLR